MDLIQLSVTVLVAFGGAYFGGKQALRNYYSQRWWDRRVDAYIKINEGYNKLFQAFQTAIRDSSQNNLLTLEEAIEDFRRIVNLYSFFMPGKVHRGFLSLAIKPNLAIHSYEEDSDDDKFHAELITLMYKFEETKKEVKKDLNIRDKSRTDQILDWASNLIKRFKQRYRLGGNSD